MRSTKLSILAMVLFGALASCGSSPSTLAYGPRSYAPSDYDEVYEKWSEERQAFELGRLEDVMAVTATFETWDFRWAYTVRYAYDYGLPLEQRRAMLKEAHRDSLNTHRFFVTLAGSNIRESDLTSKHNAWRVVLINDKGRGVESENIEKVSGTYAPERVYFPTMSPHRLAFRVSFPVRFSDGEPVLTKRSRFAILRFTGSLGSVELKWKFQTEGT
ncbi:MAG: hypothetical protein H6715_02355 [Myxococcales bacterium]|nr:hypothetical protein [Myxococcales bacterium]MCB9708753.1 hypothetical protein [Myxococcales bacterium]